MTAWIDVALLDLRREARAGRRTATLLALAVLVAVLGQAAFHDAAPASAAAGTLWTLAVLVAGLALARAFRSEADAGTLDHLLALPLGRGSVLAGKAASNTVLVAVAEAAALLVLVATSPLPLAPRPLAVAGAVLLLGTLGLVTAAALLGAAAQRARAHELLAPVLVVPAGFPLVVTGVHATTAALTPGPPLLPLPEATFMAGYDLVLAGLALLLAEAALEA